MADSSDSRGRSPVTFDRRVSLGNVLTILGGLAWAIGMLWFFATWTANQNAKLDMLQSEIADIRCALATAGIAPTTFPCVLSSPRRPTP